MRNVLFIVCMAMLAGCNSNETTALPGRAISTADTAKAIETKTPADLATILSKREVPVLCYHDIRNFKGGESESMKSYNVTPAAFADQMKTLHDSGYQTILPDQLHDYLLYGGSLPPKPVMLTFDDGDVEQYSVAAPELKKYGFKAVYFIMTIAMNRPRYMKKEQIRELSDSGHVIASHTWDHHMVTKYKGETWDTQLVKSKVQLETITGKPVKYFAYPFGLWNKEAVPEIRSRGYNLAFILSTKRDSTEPLYTVRRMIVPGTWSSAGMIKAMNTTFNKKQ